MWKRVSTNVYCCVLGSSMVTARFVRSSGKSLAEGWSEPFLQKSGLLGPRTVAANHTRPFRSNIPLWLLAFVFQIFSSPQYGDGCMSLSLAAWPGPSASGVFASRTGATKFEVACFIGSRIGMMSVLYSADP